MPDGGSLTIRSRNVSERESLKLAGSGIAAGEYILIEVDGHRRRHSRPT